MIDFEKEANVSVYGNHLYSVNNKWRLSNLILHIVRIALIILSVALWIFCSYVVWKTYSSIPTVIMFVLTFFVCWLSYFFIKESRLEQKHRKVTIKIFLFNFGVLVIDLPVLLILLFSGFFK